MLINDLLESSGKLRVWASIFHFMGIGNIHVIQIEKVGIDVGEGVLFLDDLFFQLVNYLVLLDLDRERNILSVDNAKDGINDDRTKTTNSSKVLVIALPHPTFGQVVLELL
jgi:hypothetical protein